MREFAHSVTHIEAALFALAIIGASSASALQAVLRSPILDSDHQQDDLTGSRKRVHHYLGIKPASFSERRLFFFAAIANGGKEAIACHHDMRRAW
ncbi:hypothetical protein Bxe_B2792 [Paraburkholderia xenovorans LB400]|uniref:Uncharacterized protein n=1 Tax=Paraburkholderia xenovorans (strain LB400) TaxID=266265 RepID=Q13RT6_PARXL|nr:hypothetical protein Bxe_B2792 [Paraburkholderia xenovorans LB400]